MTESPERIWVKLKGTPKFYESPCEDMPLLECYIRADLTKPTVKPLEVASQYANPTVETSFGDYVMRDNPLYTPEPDSFFGIQVQQKKHHIYLNGMLVAHTDEPKKFLEIVQAQHEHRILSALEDTWTP